MPRTPSSDGTATSWAVNRVTKQLGLVDAVGEESRRSWEAVRSSSAVAGAAASHSATSISSPIPSSGCVACGRQPLEALLEALRGDDAASCGPHPAAARPRYRSRC